MIIAEGRFSTQSLFMIEHALADLLLLFKSLRLQIGDGGHVHKDTGRDNETWRH